MWSDEGFFSTVSVASDAANESLLKSIELSSLHVVNSTHHSLFKIFTPNGSKKKNQVAEMALF